ncbi:hypothetical protein [Christiangramia aestuarii]|uniref:Uncharacterized protein n=1 Tax=Christiangramia aestuarii TaxID=1028746 RepID=A0A7K1LMK1_9FLAO|nr:hypothetical protein [Christiangramia aestuarii]MUP42036.1 hypothetical protein [Christiangramia aestuarii]
MSINCAMQYYYSSKKPDIGGHIRVHAQNCVELPDILARIYLGIFPNSNLAVASAREKLQLTRVKVCNCCTDQDLIS